MFFKKKTTKEKIAAKKTNYAGERMDRLDASGNLPFGWVVHNQKYVDMIEKDIQPFRDMICNANTDIEMYAALKSFLLFLQDGKEHYSKYGECVLKYFEEHICNSTEAEQRLKKFKELERKLTKDR